MKKKKVDLVESNRKGSKRKQEGIAFQARTAHRFLVNGANALFICRLSKYHGG